MPELASFLATVHGRVQGVFFRAFVEKNARTLGLTGYVNNMPGGRTIEVRAEGEREHLEDLLKRLHSGPAFARVERVDVEWSDYSGDLSQFQVRH